MGIRGQSFCFYKENLKTIAFRLLRYAECEQFVSTLATLALGGGNNKLAFSAEYASLAVGNA